MLCLSERESIGSGQLLDSKTASERLAEHHPVHLATQAVEQEVQAVIQIGQNVDELGVDADLRVQEAQRVAQHERRDQDEKEHVECEQELVDLAVLLGTLLGYVSVSHEACTAAAALPGRGRGCVLLCRATTTTAIAAAATKLRSLQVSRDQTLMFWIGFEKIALLIIKPSEIKLIIESLELIIEGHCRKISRH